MGPETSLFTMALGLRAPWSVTDVRFDANLKEIHFDVRFKAGSRFACPSCGAADQPVHDTRPRTWEHLRFFEHKAFIHAILVSELSRWGRSTQDLLDTLNRLAGWKVSVAAINGMTFELDTPHGRMMATMLAGIAQFERDLLSERVKSGLAAARARCKKLGRQPGQRPKSDKLAPKVLQAVEDGRSYRWIARDLGISKNTVTDIVRRNRDRA